MSTPSSADVGPSSPSNQPSPVKKTISFTDSPPRNFPNSLTNSPPIPYFQNGAFPQENLPRTPGTYSNLSYGTGTSEGMSHHFNMAIHTFEKCQNEGWLNLNQPDSPTALSLRVHKDNYITLPEDDDSLESYKSAVLQLNREVVMIVNSSLIRGFVSKLTQGTVEVPFSSSQRVQVLPSLNDLASVRKAQNAAFVYQENVLVVWADDIHQIQQIARQISSMVFAFVIKGMNVKPAYLQDRTTRLWSRDQVREQHKKLAQLADGITPSSSSSSNLNSFPSMSSMPSMPIQGEKSDPFKTPSIHSSSPSDLDVDEEAAQGFEYRPISLEAPLIQGLGIAANIFCLSFFVRSLLISTLADGQYIRMASLVLLPLFFMLGSFTFANAVRTVFLIIGPIKHMNRNSRYYSGQAPKRITQNLPHITIQMPVYKESVEGVILPTLQSVRAAIRTYELQGGTASIIVSDDGLKLISEKLRQSRLQCYEENDVSWVARPANGHEGYIRRGRFKKASNLNFTCQLAMNMDKYVEENASNPEISTREKRAISEAAVDELVKALHPSAEASGDIRIGEIILLIDSDTRVPEDCLLDAASELRNSPELGILQHGSGVMIVDGNYFEKGIAFFTKIVNYAISHSVAAGDIGPFMGHNAYLRWSALQEVAFTDNVDPDMLKIWSDTKVSEDFDMALRLLCTGKTVRWATYANFEYLEGVSLTAEEELNRWQKYAFGCSELIFNELRYWFTRGPLTKSIRQFLWAAVPVHYKFAALAYLFSYYSLSVCIPFTIIFYLYWGWFGPVADIPLLTGYEIWLSVIVVFTIAGSLGLMILRIRTGRESAWLAIKETVCWLPFMLVFFSGLNWHVLLALLAHPFSVNMTWGATMKDMEESNFFKELPRMLKRYWLIFLVCLIIIGGVVALAVAPLPSEWYIGNVTLMLPPLVVAAGHVLYPLLLNPSLLRFSF